MGGFRDKSYFRYYLAVIFVIALVLMPTHQARADCVGWTGINLTSCITNILSYFIFLIFSVVGKIIGVLAVVLNWVIHIRVYPDGGVPVIDASWKIMRNFANMFFIVALIVMAFATIFDVMPGAAKYNVRSLFPRFLISALLINFSLVLGVLVIDGSQILSNTFLTAIGDIGNRLGQDLNPSQLLPAQDDIPTSATTIDSAVFGTLIKLIFAVVLLFTFLFSILTAVIFAFIRIPILWALLVVSPIAWILNVFPAGQNTYKKWWSLFIGWNMFLPIFLFFLYFGLYFLSNQGQVMQKIAADLASAKPTSDLPFNFQILFFYVLAAVFLIGGTIVAMKAALFSGTGVVGVAKWGRGVALRRFGITAAQRGAMQRLGEIQREGLPGRFGVLYGGERGLERQVARWAESFGVAGARDIQAIKEIGEIKKKFERITDPAQLRTMMGKGTNQEKLAIREIMKGRNLLNSKELLETYDLYGGNSSLAGKQFARSVSYEKLTPAEREEWLKATKTDVETQQKILSVMADKGDRYFRASINPDAENNLKNALQLFNLEGEQRDLLKKIEKYELIMATRMQMERGFIKGEGGRDIRDIYTDPAVALEKSLQQVIQRMGPDALLEATKTLTNIQGQNDEETARFRQMVINSLNPQKIEAMMTKGTQEQLENWRRLDPGRFDEERIRAEKERAARELAEITGRATGEAITRAGGFGAGARGNQPPPPPRRPVGFVRPGETPQGGNVVNLRNRNNP